jgi:hypothetical protein
VTSFRPCVITGARIFLLRDPSFGRDGGSPSRRLPWAHRRPRLCNRAHPGRIGVLACALAARADRYCLVVLICGVYRRGRLYAQESSRCQQVNESQRILALDLGCCYFNAMKLFLLSLLLAASCLCAETDTNLYDRVFFLNPPIFSALRDASKPFSCEEQSKQFMTYFQDHHNVQWPEGSKLVIDEPSRLHSFYIRNTRQQLSKMEDALSNMDVLLNLRHTLEIALIAFHKEDVEPLHTKGTVTAESLLMLHKRGRSKTLSCQKVLTLGGQEATFKDTQEFIYPSNYSTENSITNSGCESMTVLLPGNFTMREVGTTCSIVLEPSDNNDSLFILDTNLSYTSLKDWTSFEALLATKNGAAKETCAQPIFTCLPISGKRAIRPKETALMGGGTLDDDWVAYLFVTLGARGTMDRNENSSTRTLAKEVTK